MAANGHSSTDKRDTRTSSDTAKPILEPEASAALRDQLLAELKDIASADDAATWAHRILGAKNSLTAADARMIEDAFQARLATFGRPPLALSTRRYRRDSRSDSSAERRLSRTWQSDRFRRHRQEPLGPPGAASLS